MLLAHLQDEIQLRHSASQEEGEQAKGDIDQGSAPEGEYQSVKHNTNHVSPSILTIPPLTPNVKDFDIRRGFFRIFRPLGYFLLRA